VEEEEQVPAGMMQIAADHHLQPGRERLGLGAKLHIRARMDIRLVSSGNILCGRVAPRDREADEKVGFFLPDGR
jgi:hypothetical protein